MLLFMFCSISYRTLRQHGTADDRVSVLNRGERQHLVPGQVQALDLVLVGGAADEDTARQIHLQGNGDQSNVFSLSQTSLGIGRPAKSASVSGPSGSRPKDSTTSANCRVCWPECQPVRSSTSSSVTSP